MAVVKKIKTVFQFRRSTTEEWELNKNLIPAAGEPCYDLNLKTLRIGDGTSTYENLPVVGGAELSVDGETLILENGAVTISGFDAAEAGSYIRKGADGSIEWVEIPTAGDLQSELENIKAEMAAVQEDVSSVQEQVGETDVAAVQESVVQMTQNVTNLTTQIEQQTTELVTIQETLENKADAEKVVELQTVIEQKVDEETVNAMSTELRTYIDEQIKLVEIANMDDGEI